jgi:catechol 2,3-dioxygenase-like lactoylglutathione lyase family enzyme
MLGALRRVYLEVDDLQESQDFYCNYLGLMLVRRDELGEHCFALLQAQDWELLVSEQRSGRRRRKREELGAGVVLGVEVEDVDRTCRELALRSVRIALEPHATPWGERCALISDPDGYRIMLIERAAAKE